MVYLFLLCLFICSNRCKCAHLSQPSFEIQYAIRSHLFFPMDWWIAGNRFSITSLNDYLKGLAGMCCNSMWWSLCTGASYASIPVLMTNTISQAMREGCMALIVLEMSSSTMPLNSKMIFNTGHRYSSAHHHHPIRLWPTKNSSKSTSVAI